MSAEQSLLLPFDQFVFAELKSDGKEQRLRLVFATHEITLRGHSLRRIEVAMQRMEIALVSALSPDRRALVPLGQPLVHEIIVTQAEKPKERPSDGSK